jgi:hypothetical protein
MASVATVVPEGSVSRLEVSVGCCVDIMAVVTRQRGKCHRGQQSIRAFLCTCAKSNWGPELMLNRDPGVLEATLFVCVSTYWTDDTMYVAAFLCNTE